MKRVLVISGIFLTSLCFAHDEEFEYYEEPALSFQLETKNHAYKKVWRLIMDDEYRSAKSQLNLISPDSSEEAIHIYLIVMFINVMENDAKGREEMINTIMNEACMKEAGGYYRRGQSVPICKADLH